MKPAFFALFVGVFHSGLCQPAAELPSIGTAKGVVFDDRNRNAKRDEGEPGVGGVLVSNQLIFVKTNSRGEWQLPYSDDTTFFVVKPRNWMTPVDKRNCPKFYYIHKPNGSPQGFKYPGVAPTGTLPASIDFALYRRPEPNEFTAVFFGDTQPRDLREVDYLARGVIEPLIGTKEKFDFGVTLGDVVFDDLSVMEPMVQTIGLIGIPWYYVLGNHDINYDASDDGHSDEFWERTLGPNYYSFDHGPTHFVVLDDVIWIGKENAQKIDPKRTGGFYEAGLGKMQMQWLRNDLAMVPTNKLVVLMMHIPINEIKEKSELFKLIAERPYALSVSAHTHYQEHRFLKADDGWPKPEPHHHVVNVTTCGSWWSGAPDGRGVPHTTMRDGAPNGYSVFVFDGTQYSIQFRAAGKKKSYQLNILAPDAVSQRGLYGTSVYANVFGGSERSKVEISFNGGPWEPMVKVQERDPEYAAAYERDRSLKLPYRALPAPIVSPHLWKSALRSRLPVGVYPIHVRTTDMFGQVSISTRALRVVGNSPPVR